MATAINDAELVVGYSFTSGNAATHATLWSGTTAIDLDTSGGFYSVAAGINSAGLIVGRYLGGATIWNGATATILSSNGAAAGINNNGLVVGSIFGASLSSATLWNGAGSVNLVGLVGLDAQALAVNNAGQVVGSSWGPNGPYEHATLWNGATPTYLGSLGGTSSRAASINSIGQAVGFAQTASGEQRATLWSSGTVTDLNDYLDFGLSEAGWVLASASGINDGGSVVGQAYNRLTNQQQGFVLSVTAVPEPKTYALMLAGLGLMSFVARRFSKL